MKFAALVLLLVAGSQAASMQSDAPDVPTPNLDKAREFLLRVTAPFDTTEYGLKKNEAIEKTHAKLKELWTMAQPLIASVMEATKDMREAVNEDATLVQTKFDQVSAPMRKTLTDHYEKYVGAFDELTKFVESKRDDVETFKNLFQAGLVKFVAMVPDNWQETKTEFKPLTDVVLERATHRRGQIKEAAMPYWEESLAALNNFIQNPESMSPMIEELKLKAATAVQSISGQQ